MKKVKIFYDLETTGVKVHRHSIHHLAGLIEVDGEVVEDFDFKVQPNPKAIIEAEALAMSGVTESQVLDYPEMKVVYKKFVNLIGKYIDRYNKQQKAYLVGYNNRKFDDEFLRAWFEQNGDKFFGSWFWTDSHDAMIFASWYLEDRRSKMPSFKLHRVATEMGLVVDKTKLHDAVYDVYLTRSVYRIAVGIDIEL